MTAEMIPEKQTQWLSGAKWIGTVAGVSGAILIALNLGMGMYGFWLYLISSILWSIVGWTQRETSLFVLQATFSSINVVGIVRWLGH